MFSQFINDVNKLKNLDIWIQLWSLLLAIYPALSFMKDKLIKIIVQKELCMSHKNSNFSKIMHMHDDSERKRKALFTNNNLGRINLYFLFVFTRTIFTDCSKS